MNSMIWKELREQVRWMPIGLLLVGCVLLLSLPGPGLQGIDYAWEADQVTIPIFSLLAMALGFLQSIPASRPEARAHLLHRPLERGRIVWARWIVGAALYFTATLAPVLLTAIWLEAVGPETRPTSWVQVIPTIAIAFGCFSFYFAATWTIDRPARWLGTRLLPLVAAAAVPLLTLIAMSMTSGTRGYWMLLVLSVGLTICALSAKHAFCRLADLPPPSSPAIAGWASVIGFLGGGVLLSVMATLGLFMLSKYLDPPRFDADSRRYAVTADGHPWQVDYTNPWVQSQLATGEQRTARYDLRGAAPRQPQSVPDDWKEVQLTRLGDPWWRGSALVQPFRNVIQDGFGGRSVPFDLVMDRFGRLLCYDPAANLNSAQTAYQSLLFVVTPAGVFRTSSAAGHASGFTDGVRASYYLHALPSEANRLTRQHLLVNQRSIHLIDILNQKVQLLLERPIDSYAMTYDERNEMEYLWLKAGDVLTGYTIQFAAETGETGETKIRGVSLRPLVTLAVPARAFPQSNLQVAVVDDGYVVLSPPYETPPTFVSFDTQGRRQTTETFADVLPQPVFERNATLGIAPLPPIFLAAFSAIEGVYAVAHDRQPLIIAQWQSERGTLVGICLVMALSSLTAGLLTSWLAGRRDRPWRSRLAWILTATLFTWSAVLAFVALYPRVLREPCPHCDRPRRIDRPNCEHCHHAWESARDDGVEIFEQAPARAAAEPAATTADS